MSKFIALGASLLIVGLSVLYFNAKADEPNAKKETTGKPAGSVAEQLKTLEDEFNAKVEKLKERGEKAKTEQAQTKIKKEFDDILSKFMESTWAIAKDHPQDPASLDALIRVATESDDEKLTSAAMDLVLAEHVKNPKIGAFCLAIAGSGQDNPKFDPFLKAVIDSNPDKGAKGMASLAQGLMLKSKADANAELKPAEREKLLDAAEKSLEETVKAYGDVKTPAEANEKPQTIASLAKPFLFQLQHLRIGKVAPEIDGKDGDDKQLKLSDYRGRVVVVDFWATWCGPCMALVPHEKELVERLKDKPFAFLGVNADQEKQDLIDVAKKKEITWRNFWDGEGEIQKQWGIQYYPTIFVIDHKGVIRYKDVREKALDEAVDQLLSEVPAEAKAEAKKGS